MEEEEADVGMKLQRPPDQLISRDTRATPAGGSDALHLRPAESLNRTYDVRHPGPDQQV